MHASPTTSRALIASDTASDVRIIRDILARMGFAHLDSACDAKAAMAAVASRPPDMLILDWDVRVGSAEALVTAARKASDRTTIVVTMAMPTSRKVAAAKALKVDSIVVRPFSPRAFRARLPRLPEGQRCMSD